jgi:hypothetical protein
MLIEHTVRITCVKKKTLDTGRILFTAQNVIFPFKNQGQPNVNSLHIVVFDQDDFAMIKIHSQAKM